MRQGYFAQFFCCKRVCFSACWKIWCSRCYLPHLWDQFPTAFNSENDNEEGFEEVSEGGELRFREGINGDILMGVLFQCEPCPVQNMEDRDPEEKGEKILMVLRRYYINLLWSRDSGIISGNLSSPKRVHMEKIGKVIIERKLTRLEPMTLSDVVWMKLVVLLLQK